MQKNLNVCKYRNGDNIPQVQYPTAWEALSTGAWCYYSNDAANGPVYGKLYNWYAVNDPRGLAPIGYHIPSDSEYTTLTTFLGGEMAAGDRIKATTLWGPYSGITKTNSTGLQVFQAVTAATMEYSTTLAATAIGEVRLRTQRQTLGTATYTITTALPTATTTLRPMVFRCVA